MCSYLLENCSPRDRWLWTAFYNLPSLLLHLFQSTEPQKSMRLMNHNTTACFYIVAILVVHVGVHFHDLSKWRGEKKSYRYFSCPPPSTTPSPPRPPFIKWGLWAKCIIKTAHYSGQPGWWGIIVADSAQVAVTERRQLPVVISLGAAALKFNAACIYSILTQTSVLREKHIFLFSFKLLLKEFSNNKMYFCVVLCCSLKHISIYYSPLCPIKFKSSGSGWVERLFPGG